MQIDSETFVGKLAAPASWEECVYRYCTFERLSEDGLHVTSVFLDCRFESCDLYGRSSTRQPLWESSSETVCSAAAVFPVAALWNAALMAVRSRTTTLAALAGSTKAGGMAAGKATLGVSILPWHRLVRRPLETEE